MQATGNSIKVLLAYQVARRLVARRQKRTGINNATAADWKTYFDWRYKSLKAQFTQNFGAGSVAGKDVLDFGCGDGSLSIILADIGARSVHGIDLDERGLAKFSERLKQYTGECRLTCSRSSSGKKIDLPDQSVDCIFCFDVMEHVIDYREIIFEWRRVLRPGGKVYIWWQPYWHPFGHHLHDWIPIPWVHTLLNEEEMDEVCARVVDWPEFKPSVWDQNPDGSRKNRFRGGQKASF